MTLQKVVFLKTESTLFLDNPHRILLTLIPDQAMEEKEGERVEKELDRILADTTPSELEKISEDTRALKQLQEEIEDVSCLPTLALDDIPPSVQRVKPQPHIPRFRPRVIYSRHPEFSILLAVAGSGLLPKDRIPLVPFFCYAFTKIGTALHDYVEMARHMDAHTGGMSLSCHARTGFEGAPECLPFIAFNGKCLVRNQDNMFEIIEEFLHNFDFSDLIRLKSLFLEYQAGLESMVVQNGHRLAMSLASRNFSISNALNETWSGIHQLKTIKTITQNLSDDNLKSISHELKEIGRTLFIKNNLKIALIGEGPALSSASSAITSIQKGLESGTEPITSTDGFTPPDMNVVDEIPREG